MPRTSVAVYTASFGDGHNAAARSLAEAIQRAGHDCIGPCDLLGELFPMAMPACSAGYRQVITKLPKLWSGLYNLADRTPLGGDGIDFMPRITRGFATHLNQHQPTAVISTYPLYGHLLDRLFGIIELPFPLLTMVTDAKSINRSWLHQAHGHFAVVDDCSARYFIDGGIAPERVHVTGFPVGLEYAERSPEQLEDALPNPLKILYTPSTRTSHVRKTLKAIAAATEAVEIELTVVLGRHADRLQSAVKSLAPAGSSIIGWTDRMPELLCESHLFIGKAGGAAVQEAIAAACPMLVNYVVPGQEEGNAEILCASGGGALTDTPEALETNILRLLHDDGRNWLTMRQAAFRERRPRATEKIVALLEQLIEQHSG